MVVAVVALRQLRPRPSGRNEWTAGSVLNIRLRRFTWRYSSQRDESRHAESSQRCFDQSRLRLAEGNPGKNWKKAD
jgi:hypothetical protein